MNSLTAWKKTSEAVSGLIQTFLHTKRGGTLTAYRQDLEALQRFAETSDVPAAVGGVLEGGALKANQTIAAFRQHMIEGGLAGATINRRLSAIRSLTTLARAVGLIDWTVEVPGVKQVAYRDTRGPDGEGMRRLFKTTRQRTDAKGLRDYAILRLLFDLGLRRAEVTELDLAHVCLTDEILLVRGKGYHDREALTLPGATINALRAWIRVRGRKEGALFYTFDRASDGQARLTCSGLHRIVTRLGRRAGIKVRPHGLRHAAITTALDLTNGDVRAVQKFSRHANVATVIRYDDNRQDLAGDVATQVAETQ